MSRAHHQVRIIRVFHHPVVLMYGAEARGNDDIRGGADDGPLDYACVNERDLGNSKNERDLGNSKNYIELFKVTTQRRSQLKCKQKGRFANDLEMCRYSGLGNRRSS